MIMNMAYGGGAAASSKLLSALNVGDTLEVPVAQDAQLRFGTHIVWKVADKNHTGYPANSVTLITDKILCMLCADAREPSNSDTDRKNYGNNRHIYSNLLQWLNSGASAGDWFVKQHDADMYPIAGYILGDRNPYYEWPGFLTTFGADFVQALLDTTLTVSKVDEDGGGQDTFTRKIFLASRVEVGLGDIFEGAEGAPLALFSDDASRVAYPSIACVYNSDFSSANFAPSNAWNWWLRTPHYSYTMAFEDVDDTGDRGSGSYAYATSTGVRPLCNLPGSLRVSESPNAAGNYTLLD